MSSQVHSGIDYAYVKRHYDADDYVSLVVNGVPVLNGIPFTATPTYYVSGLIAYASDPDVVDPYKGWTTYAHGENAPPAYLAPFLAGLGITTWPSEVPAFEAKDLLFYATQDCWVQFEGRDRTRHYIPANTFMRFHRRCFKFYVTRVAVSGTLYAWLEG